MNQTIFLGIVGKNHLRRKNVGNLNLPWEVLYREWYDLVISNVICFKHAKCFHSALWKLELCVNLWGKCFSNREWFWPRGNMRHFWCILGGSCQCPLRPNQARHAATTLLCTEHHMCAHMHRAHTHHTPLPTTKTWSKMLVPPGLKSSFIVAFFYWQVLPYMRQWVFQENSFSAQSAASQ